jgi:hypothetical protein
LISSSEGTLVPGTFIEEQLASKKHEQIQTKTVFSDSIFFITPSYYDVNHFEIIFSQGVSVLVKYKNVSI